MKILNTNNFILERVKIKPVTNAELNKAKDDMRKNKYNLTKEDMIGNIKGFPIGIVVRMLEEQESQGNNANVTKFQANLFATCIGGGFDWQNTGDGAFFWNDVIGRKNFERFFEKHPEYTCYNLD